MGRTILTVLGLVLGAAPPFAQSTGTSADAAVRVNAALEAALVAGVPVERLHAKIAEGRAKGVSEARIAAVVEQRAAVLARIRAALEARGEARGDDGRRGRAGRAPSQCGRRGHGWRADDRGGRA